MSITRHRAGRFGAPPRVERTGRPARIRGARERILRSGAATPQRIAEAT
jgi:hypothetical protein